MEENHHIEEADQDFIDWLISHLTHPCEARGMNLREVYIGEAERVLTSNDVTDPHLREQLEFSLRIAKIINN